jgi:hypothetical protein
MKSIYLHQNRFGVPESFFGWDEKGARHNLLEFENLYVERIGVDQYDVGGILYKVKDSRQDWDGHHLELTRI